MEKEKKPMKVLPYSYSSLTSFESCAFKHYKIKVSKEVIDPPYAAAEFGIKVHAGAEDYVVKGTPYEGDYAPRIVAVVDHYRALPETTLLAEHKLCVTRTQQPTDWFAADGHARGIIDLLVRAPEWTHIADWKTGRPDPFSTQLKHNAMLEMFHRPEVKKVTWNYEWLKGGTKTSGVLHRDFLQKEWDSFEARVHRLEQALVAGKWPKNPNGLCRNYCPVVECEHNGQHKSKAK